MAEVSQKDLMEFVLNHRADKSDKSRAFVFQAFQFLREYFRIAKRGEGYPLITTEQLDESAFSVAAAIANATGRTVEGVEAVSSSRQFPRNGLLSDEMAPVSEYVADIIYEQCQTVYQHKFCFPLGDSLRVNLWDKLGEALGREFCPDRLRDRVREVLWNSIYFFLCCAVIGDMHNLERLVLLIELLPYAIPIGEKAGDEGVWLVLVK